MYTEGIVSDGSALSLSVDPLTCAVCVDRVIQVRYSTMQLHKVMCAVCCTTGTAEGTCECCKQVRVEEDEGLHLGLSILQTKTTARKGEIHHVLHKICSGILYSLLTL